MGRFLMVVTRDIQNPYCDTEHSSWESRAVIPAGTKLLLRTDRTEQWIGSVYGLGREISAQSPLGCLILGATEFVPPDTVHDLIAIHQAHNIDMTRILLHLTESGVVSIDEMDKAFKHVVDNLGFHPRRPKGSQISM